MGKPRVLIIDDEALIRRAMADYLSEAGYETATAADGAKGLEEARCGEFDVVLIDLRMPGMDGLEVIGTLSEEKPDMPVILVSGAGVPDGVVEAMRCGAWDYITKPFQDIDDIVNTLERVLEKARKRREQPRADRS